MCNCSSIFMNWVVFLSALHNGGTQNLEICLLFLVVDSALDGEENTEELCFHCVAPNVKLVFDDTL
jgi:hypothetical protein